jgi:hypothetical protein
VQRIQGLVTLEGAATLHGAVERAIGSAWKVPGVTAVHSRLGFNVDSLIIAGRGMKGARVAPVVATDLIRGLGQLRGARDAACWASDPGPGARAPVQDRARPLPGAASAHRRGREILWPSLHALRAVAGYRARGR